MVDGIAGANHRLVASEGLPCQADARLQGGLIELDTDSAVGGNAVRAAGNSGAACGNVPRKVRNIEVRLAVFDFGFGGHQRPGNAEVQGQIAGHAPIILNEGAN